MGFWNAERVSGSSRPVRIMACMVALAFLSGCQSATEPPLQPPVAQVSIELLSEPSIVPDPNFHLTCQTADAVLLKATGSYDPAGKRLDYEWTDRVDGELTTDFAPHPNPMRLAQPEIAVNLYRIGIHELTLRVRASDGRKATQTLRILVAPCIVCGG
jgi:hypothetical protein